jgi:serine/threonine protein kinase
MGEVYRATDSTLGRDVAIKVLPPEVAHDAERLARFRREAHLLAALNHPSIAAVYGLEEADGKPFLALELVEGEDLKERLTRGAIPVDEALEIAEQVAQALEEAHNKGIVHRDLKPANVKLTPDGKVKVLDFGLAKAWAGDASGVGSAPSALSQSPHPRQHRHGGGRDPRHGGLHVARTGARPARRQAGRRVVVRRAAVGDAHGPPALRRRHGDRCDRGRGDEGARPRRAAGRDAARGAATARAVPAEGPAHAVARHRSGTPRAAGRARREPGRGRGDRGED